VRVPFVPHVSKRRRGAFFIEETTTMSAHKIAFAIGLLSLGLLACQGDTIVSPNAGSEGIHVSGQASVSAPPTSPRPN
jgi:hypothetical protein